MLKRLAVSALVPIVLSGCADWGVKPWERDILARKDMQMISYPLEAGLEDHIYFSKEGSSGGRSFAGGGCGCN